MAHYNHNYLLLAVSATLALVLAVAISEGHSSSHQKPLRPHTHTCPSGGLRQGAACTPEDCQPCGYCWEFHSYYLRCNFTLHDDPLRPILGVVVLERCGGGMWWNPDLKPPSSSHGGSCDTWENLSHEWKLEYVADPQCSERIPTCIWGQDEDARCSEHYWFFDPRTMEERRRMNCGEGLLWDPSRQGCQPCGRVRYEDGSGCDC